MAMLAGRRVNWLTGSFAYAPQYIEPLMGWTADNDPMTHVELRFDLLAQAIRYAKQNRLDYSVQGNQGQSVEIDVRCVEAFTRERSQVGLDSQKENAMPHLTKFTDQQRTNTAIRVDDIYFHRDSTPDPNSNQELDRRLDQALQETFPASDPVAIIIL
jgi:hypothetical protein